MLSLLKHEIFSRWASILGWSIGLAMFGNMYISIYPQIGEQLASLDIPFYDSMGVDMGSFKGFLASTIVQFIALIMAIYAVLASTETLAGQEDNGTLELLATLALSRTEIVAAKALALTISSLFILFVSGLGSIISFVWIGTSFTTDITIAQFILAIMSGWPLIMAFMMIGLFFSALLPSRRAASMAATLVVLISYFGKIVTNSAPSLEFLEPFFLFSYFETGPDLFNKGVQAQDVLTLLGLAALFFALALLSFNRRDITLGMWPWQRAKRQN